MYQVPLQNRLQVVEPRALDWRDFSFWGPDFRNKTLKALSFSMQRIEKPLSKERKASL